MDDTIRRLAKVLGASGLEGLGHDGRFAVEGADGSLLKVVIEGAHQRFLAELKDAKGVLRADLDLAPVSRVSEDPAVPGRVTLHVGTLLVHVDTKPALAIELVSK